MGKVIALCTMFAVVLLFGAQFRNHLIIQSLRYDLGAFKNKTHGYLTSIRKMDVSGRVKEGFSTMLHSIRGKDNKV
jgi:hypothetical protein